MTQRIARWAFVLAALVAASAAFAQMDGPMFWPGSFEFRAACGQDVHHLCSGVPRGEGRIIECLASRRKELSTVCRTELAAEAYGGAVPYPGRGPSAHAPGPGLGRNPELYGPHTYGPDQYGPSRSPYTYGGGPDRDGYGPSRYGFAPDAQARRPGTQRYALRSPAGAGD